MREKHGHGPRDKTFFVQSKMSRMNQIFKLFDKNVCVARIAGWGVVMLFAGAMIWLTQWRMSGDYPADSYSYMDFTAHVVEYGWDASVREFSQFSTYPLLLCWLMSKLVGFGMSLEGAGRLLNIGFCLGMVWGVWSCCQVLYRDRFLAVCAALLTISLPGVFRYSGGILREPLFWCMLVWQFRMLLTWCYAKHRRWHKALLMGVLMGMGLLSRKEQIFLFPLELVLIAFLEGKCRREEVPKKRMIRVLAVLSIISGVSAGCLWVFLWSTGNNLENTCRGFFQIMEQL